MPGDPVRVAVWGVGSHARRRILPALLASTRARLHGILTRDLDVRRSVSEQYGCAAWASAEDMLGDPSVDAVYVATASGHHLDAGLQVLAAGKHLWCEKPLTTSHAGSRQLVDAGRQRDLAVCEAFMYRHHPQFQAVLDAVSAPSFGEILSVTSRFGIPHQDPSGFRYSRALGGGALFDVGCYVIDLAVALLGGEQTVIAAHRAWTPDFDVDTEGFAVLASAAGVRAHLEWAYGASYRNELFIWGRRQSLYVDRVFSKPDDGCPPILCSDATGQVRPLAVPAANSFVLMLDAFARTVWDGEHRARQWAAAEAQADVLGAIIERAPSP